MNLLGVDIGTSRTKAIVFSEKGLMRSYAANEYPLMKPRPDWSEMDAGYVWDQIRKTIRESVERSEVDSSEIDAVSISALGHAVLPVDKSLNALHPAIQLYDQRGKGFRESLREEIGASKLWEETQTRSIQQPVGYMRWWKDNMPEVYESTYKFVGWHDYVIWQLCGEPVADISLAWCMGAYDVTNLKWSDAVLDAAGLDSEKLPRVEKAGTPLDKVTAEGSRLTGLSEETTVVLGAHDCDCSMLGAGVVHEGMASDLSGTFELLWSVVPPTLDIRKNPLCWGINRTEDIMLSWTASSSTCGSLINWFKDTFCVELVTKAEKTGKDVYDLLNLEAKDTPIGSNGLMVLSDFSLSKETVGSIIGLNLSHTKGDVFRAILEGITFEVMTSLEGKPEYPLIKEVGAIGGGSKSPLWLQIKADVFNRKVASTQVHEGGALGAAILSGIGVECYDDAFDGVEKTVREATVYEPNPESVKKYSDLFRAYKTLKSAVRPVSSI